MLWAVACLRGLESQDAATKILVRRFIQPRPDYAIFLHSCGQKSAASRLYCLRVLCVLSAW